jgi:hypothetical protein
MGLVGWLYAEAEQQALCTADGGSSASQQVLLADISLVVIMWQLET